MATKRIGLTSPSGETLSIDPEHVSHLREGTEDETTVVELESRDCVLVAGRELEKAAALGRNPLDRVAPLDNDASIEDLVEHGGESV